MERQLSWKRKKSTLTPGTLFLIDSSGAFLTGIFLGLVLYRWEEYFGMPRNVLFPLSVLAFIFSIYSFSCYFFSGRNWRGMLTLIAVANGIYCCISMALVIFYRERLTILGWAYFIIEIIVITLLVYLEWRTVMRAKRQGGD